MNGRLYSTRVDNSCVLCSIMGTGETIVVDGALNIMAAAKKPDQLLLTGDGENSMALEW